MTTNINKSIAGKISFYANLIGFVFFFTLIVIHFQHLEGRFTAFLQDVLTLPFIVIGFFILFYSIIALFMDRFSIKSYSFLGFIMLLCTLLLILTGTLLSLD